MPRRVVVEPHDPRWAKSFEAESRLVARALSPGVTAVHHIGSTAIPGTCAKPIIDILVEVADISTVDTSDPDMTALGYESMGECGIAGRRYFRKEDEAGTRTHHVHVFTSRSPEALRHLAFRDFMLAHHDWAGRYSDLKRRLAQAHPNDIEAYIEGKDAFIKEVNQRAAEWRAPSP
jgi:GrpB-like predicted nucleotidyltransferase (UPF0157 family)